MRSALLTFTILAATLGAQDPEPARATTPVVGAAAPVFRVNDHTGAAVRVGGEAKTWTVLAFYPKAATPG